MRLIITVVIFLNLTLVAITVLVLNRLDTCRPKANRIEDGNYQGRQGRASAGGSSGQSGLRMQGLGVEGWAHRHRCCPPSRARLVALQRTT